MREKLEELQDLIKARIADAQAWFARLTQRERRLVLAAAGTFSIFIIFVLLFSFATSAAGYRRRTEEKLAKLQEIQVLGASYGQAQQQRMDLEQQLARSGDVRLLSYVQEKGEQAGLTIPTLNPKGDVPLGDDGKIVESSVEVTLTDIPLNKLVSFLTAVENSPGIVKIKFIRLEPRPASQTLTAWATVATYKLKP